jgi:hypothetical protein
MACAILSILSVMVAFPVSSFEFGATLTRHFPHNRQIHGDGNRTAPPMEWLGECRTSHLGQELPFATPMERVWNAVENRPSTPRSRERRQSAG